MANNTPIKPPKLSCPDCKKNGNTNYLKIMKQPRKGDLRLLMICPICGYGQTLFYNSIDEFNEHPYKSTKVMPHKPDMKLVDFYNNNKSLFSGGK